MVFTIAILFSISYRIIFIVMNPVRLCLKHTLRATTTKVKHNQQINEWTKEMCRYFVCEKYACRHVEVAILPMNIVWWFHKHFLLIRFACVISFICCIYGLCLLPCQSALVNHFPPVANVSALLCISIRLRTCFYNCYVFLALLLLLLLLVLYCL